MPFERWSERIAAADDERARRELLAEIGRWRAARLTDIPAMREAAFAMSELYTALGNHEAALREAKALVSLAQTPPVAIGEEIAAAQAWLRNLGAKPVMAGKVARKAEEGRGKRRESARKKTDRSAKANGRDHAARLAASGRYDQALHALDGARGPSAALVRTWVRLAQALALPDAGGREAAVRDLEADLRASLAPAPPERRPAAEPPPPAAPSGPKGDTDHPLSDLVGAPVPRKWKPRLRLIESWHAEHPDRVDDLAALALDHHVAQAGLKSPAPWLIGLVGQALTSGEGKRTRETLARLQADGAYAVTAYDESPFTWLTGVLRAGVDRDWSDVSLRRGVSSRGEPRGRRIWTLRFTEGGHERQIAAAAAQEQPYPEGVAAKLAARLPDLCPRSVLVAPGPGNAELREAAAALGVSVVAEPDSERLLAAAAEVAPVAAPQPPAEAAPAEAGDPLQALRALLVSEQAPEESALAGVLRAMDRLHPALRTAQEALETLDVQARTPRVLAFLRAAHAVAPDHAHLPEGITLTVRTVVAGGEQARAAMLEAPTRVRYGAHGADVLLDMARALSADGWSVERVLRGPTARERRSQPVVDVLDDTGEGIWRMRLRSGELKADVWLLSGLTPEGRAAVPHLLDDKPRTIVLADDDDLVAWFETLDEPSVRWTGGEALRAAVGKPEGSA